MYKIEKGILHRDGEKRFALGQSYYPSFHHAKYPVPPEGDRIGEMKKDLKMMAEMGFDHVRFAALGLVKLEGDKLVIDTPFVDAMIQEADKNGISVSVRLQGYAVNLRDFRDVAMVDQYGTPQDMTVWYDFIQTGFHHPGLLEDNRTFTAGLSRHFRKYANVVAFQIYNEPHFPGKTFFDYHPVTVEAYRRWLVEKGIKTVEEAASYEPPRGRKEQGDRMWALWRLFSRDSLTAFLNNAAEGAVLPTYTCFTADPVSMRAAYRGCDLFANAKSMDVVGYTCYIHGVGADHYQMSLLGDIAQCAAELEGKQSWCVELDSRTYIPPFVFNRNTYTTLGSGVKGIVYYQWRGDCPVPGVPHPNSCGLLNFDGTKTANFENAATAIAFIRRHNDLLANARRLHQGIGLIYSDYARYLCDARENDGEGRMDDLHNSYMMEFSTMYRQLRKAGYTVSIIDGDHLDKDPFGIRVLLVPHPEDLAPEELAAVDRFALRGGQVYCANYGYDRSCEMGYRLYRKEPLPYTQRVYDLLHTADDLPDVTGIAPVAVPVSRGLGMQALTWEGKTVLVLTNIATCKTVMDAVLKLNIPASKVVCYAMDGEKKAALSGGILTVEGITDGAIVILE